jgi:protoporphyrin/coproporphyrin ferrochelatase
VTLPSDPSSPASGASEVSPLAEGAVRWGVLLSAHGTVDDVADIPAFLSIIRRGRPTPAEIVNEVTHRFERIGGSPLLRITRAQAAALQTSLRNDASIPSAAEVGVFVGMRLWRPTLDTALEEAVEAGITDLLSLPLAPQSVAVYHAALHEAADRRRAAGKPTPRIVEAPSWGENTSFIDSLAECVEEGLATLPEHLRANAEVVLSAHSLPLRVLSMGDRYEIEFRAVAEAVIAHRLARGATQHHVIAFQSQGMDGGAWLGPDLATVYEQANARGATALVIAPIGFVADHVETLYDLDIEARERATSAGLVFGRAPAPNDRPSFIEALARVATPFLR